LPQDGMTQVLRRLDPPEHPNLIVGTDTLDDAGVFRLDDETALVQTTDFFPPLVDDPYDFGQIAAANAMSDVYAMGGEPLTALNVVAYPDDEAPYEWLVEILRGGQDKVREAGAVIVGGHSVRDREIKYGLAVTGRVHPQRVLTNAAAKPGHVLVLTKPIGSGVLTSAAKAGTLPAAELRECVAVMVALNRPGRDAAVEVGVSACTDVTGFGLVGHAFEMAEASNVRIELSASKIPLIGRTLEFARGGYLTRACRTTRSHLGDRLEVAPGIDPKLVEVLLDAQTSGGLLLSVPEARCDALVRSLEAQGALCAAAVGNVQEGAGRVRLV
jgi:selenide,water dikinase